MNKFIRMPFRDRMTIFLRTFAVQGSWNFPRMQGLGFFHVLAPWLRKVSGDGFQETFRRHLGYFNTHPFLVSYIAGVVARLELEGRGDESVRVRDSMMGPLGAKGDGLFWARVRPAAALLGLAVSFYWPWAAAPVFLLAFNALHLLERWYGIEAGFSRNDTLFGVVDGGEKKVISTLTGHMIMPGCGFILGVFAFRSHEPVPVLALFGLGFLLFRRKLRTPPVFACLLAAALALVALGVRMRLPWSM
jgi:mannose/fructose/N-acetylgalactosamine-specific phosphotransferase system component IID